MKKSTVGLTLSIVGVAVILVPVSLFLITGYGSPIQRLLDSQFILGLPLGVVISAGGAATAAVGVVLFIRGMRAIGASPPFGVYNRRAREPFRPSREQNLNEVEVEIERLINEQVSESEPRVEVRTPQPRQAVIKPPQAGKPMEEAVAKQISRPRPQPLEEARTSKVEVISRGLDMVCRACGAVNALGQTICSVCGGRIFEPNPKLLPCPVCSAPLEGEHKVGDRVICTVCFSELSVRK
ncbi:MAG: hypothetical protein QW756_02715 [Nitrososphaerota archaeon]